MTESIAHRGPDDFGYYGWDTGKGTLFRETPPAQIYKVGLGFRRLSILDLSRNGAQPMATPDGRFTLVFNGQIYNHEELRAQLPDVKWRSHSDSEVLLHLLARMGIHALSKLNGMYAFAFFDSQTGEMLLARDPIGIKPLYYFSDDRGLFFASEIRALLKARREKPSVRKELLTRYLANGWIPDPDTLFEGIYRVNPGHFLLVKRDGEVAETQFWEFEAKARTDLTKRQWKDRLETVLDDSLRRQMRSDVPLGFFLSGGVDSSLLTVRAAKITRHRPLAFSVGFQWKGDPSPGEDMRASRLLGSHFSLNRREILVEPRIVDLLPKVTHVLEEPIADAAALCSYLICEAAKSQVKVLVSGQGADELFGGYPIYQAGYVASKLNAMPAMSGLMKFSSRLLPYSLGGRQIQSVHRLKKIAAAMQETWPDPFLFLRSPFRKGELEDLLAPELVTHQLSPYGRHLEFFQRAKGWDLYDQMLYLDTKTYLPALNLAYSDKTSMAHSVELRVPFLDQEMVSFAESLPTKYKATLTGSKVLLKSVAERTLPKQIVRRRKAGFGLPLRDWFVKDLQPMASDLLASDRLKRQGLFDSEKPSQWLREHRELKADHCTKLYTMMTLQLWLDSHSLSP